MPEGEAAANTLAGQLRQIKRRFRSTVDDFVDEKFFQAADNAPNRLRFNKENFAKGVAAAYDVRSRYLHTGRSFGAWIAPRKELSEVRHGMPEIDVVPTYIGLERVIRYCLIRFAERHRLVVEITT